MIRRRLKVAFIHQPWSVIRPPIDSADSVALLTDQIARRLAKHCDVIEYCRLGKGQSRVERFEGVEYRRASVSIDRWSKLIMQALDRRGWRNPRRPFFSSSLCYRQFIEQVMSDLAGQDCDIVHIQNFTQFVPLVRARFPRMRIVIQMHCQWLTELDEAMIRARVERADLVLGVSEFLARKARQRFSNVSARFSHVYNGADTELFARPDGAEREPKRILFVGRLSPEKGVHTLLDAFAIVRARHPDAHLEIIGPMQVVPPEMILPFSDDPKVRAMAHLYSPGAYARRLDEKLAQLPAGSVTMLKQGLAHSQLPAHYRSAAVFVAPSMWEEPFGMPLVEAMLAGAPAIATRGGAFPEIVEHEQTGLLVERDDPQDLANAICALFDDPARRDALTRAGQDRALAHFTWDRAVESLLGHYRALAQPSPASERPATA